MGRQKKKKTYKNTSVSMYTKRNFVFYTLELEVSNVAAGFSDMLI